MLWDYQRFRRGRLLGTLLLVACVGALGCAHSTKHPTEGTQSAADSPPPVYKGTPIAEPDTRSVADMTKDTGITNVIRARLLADETVSATRIIVHTYHGEVSLSGVVTSPAAHQRAITIAQSTPGVTAVHDSLTMLSR